MTETIGEWLFESLGRLRWDSVLSARNFRPSKVSGSVVSATAQVGHYPDSGESGDTYDEEMVELEAIGQHVGRIRTYCPTCGRVRDEPTDMVQLDG